MLLRILPLSWLVLGTLASPTPLDTDTNDIQCVLDKYNRSQVSRSASKYCSSVLEKTMTATTRVTPLVTSWMTASVTDKTRTVTSTTSTSTETTAFSTILTTTTATSGTHAKRTAAAIPPPKAVATYPTSILSCACDRFIHAPTTTITTTKTAKAKIIRTTTTVHVTARTTTTTTATKISTVTTGTLAATPSCDPGTDSILNNYGFEASAMYPWGGAGTVDSSRAEIVSTPSNPNDGGSHVLQVTIGPDPQSASVFTMSQDMNICPLTTYTASLDIMFLTELNNGGVLFYLIFPDGSSDWLQYLIPANDGLPTNEWLHYEWTYTTREGLMGAKMAMQAMSWMQTTDFVFALDNVKMVPGGSPSP